MYNVHLSCPREQVQALVEALQQPCAPPPETMTVLDWGFSQKQIVGYIVLVWAGEVDEAFLAGLDTTAAILDYCVYSCADNPDAYPFGGLSLAQRKER